MGYQRRIPLTCMRRGTGKNIRKGKRFPSYFPCVIFPVYSSKFLRHFTFEKIITESGKTGLCKVVNVNGRILYGAQLEKKKSGTAPREN